MRELILRMSLSLDGFAAGANGEADWIFDNDGGADDWVLENLWNASLHIMGSRSFEVMAQFYPTSALPFADPMNQIPKAVFSARGRKVLQATLGEKSDATGWSNAYVADGDLIEEVARLKATDGKPILAHGGIKFARSLVAHNLVDEYVVGIHPVALGKGQSIFWDLPSPIRLELVSSQGFSGGTVAQVYRPR